VKVLLLSRYERVGASSRLRSYQYLDYLRRAGCDVSVNALLSDVYVRQLYQGKSPSVVDVCRGYVRRLKSVLRAHEYDLLWIERELLPWVPNIVERFVLPAKVPYVVDFDDAVFHRYDMHPKVVVRRMLGRKIDAVMHHATTVIVGNEYLRERAVAAGARCVEVLPTVVDLARYTVRDWKAESCPVVGWIGTPETQGFLGVVAPALAELLRTFCFKVVLVRANLKALPGVEHETVAWSEVSEVEAIRQFDIGIMPVPDYPFARGKCGYKLIQYMACGLPVVASPIGINSKLIDHGFNGFLASSKAEWVAGIGSLLSSSALSRDMGARGRRLVDEQYSLHTAAPALLRILMSASGGPKGLFQDQQKTAPLSEVPTGTTPPLPFVCNTPGERHPQSEQ
jgi:glycosyltransferase involved in cell wall biosynthesis